MITYGEYFKRRSDGETVKDIAASIGKHTKAINRALEKGGYVAEGTGNNQKWIYKGEGKEPLDQELIFGRSTTQKQYASTIKSIEKVNKNVPKASKSVQQTNKGELDALDMLFNMKEGPKRTYRGFYFDNDVLSVIDSIKAGNKSDLVNEALRKVFKEKGWLE